LFFHPSFQHILTRFSTHVDLKVVANFDLTFVKIDQTSLELAIRLVYMREKQYSSRIKGYKTKMNNIIQFLAEDAGINLSKKELEKDIDGIFAFERDLANISVPFNKLGNKTKISLYQLDKQLTFVR